MKKSLAVATIAAMVLAPIPAQAKTGPWCTKLAKQPAYHYYYQGSRIDIPSGKRIIRYEHPSEKTCKVLVKEYRSHR